MDNKKELFGVLLEMLKEIDRVCKKNGIQYWVGFGTLLGTIRHKGFIPWDDDIDLIMTRDNLEKFNSCCQSDLNKKYFIQTTLNENGYYKYVTRVRNSETTLLQSTEVALIKSGRIPKYNMGVFVSIFPMDIRPSDFRKLKHQRKMASIRNRLLISNCYGVKRTLKNRIARLYCGIVGYKNIFRRLQKSYSKYSIKDGNMYQIPEVIYYRPDWNKWHWDIDCFKETVYMDFEDMKVPVPEGYDSILSTTYGDYMLPPSEEKKGIISHSEIVDVHMGYKEYIRNHFKKKRS